MNNGEDRQINDEAKKAFEDAKKAFSGFKDIDWVTPTQVKIAPGALPVINPKETEDRIKAAMIRIYGQGDEPIPDVELDPPTYEDPKSPFLDPDNK